MHHAASLLVDLAEAPLPVTGPSPTYIVLAGGKRVPRALLVSNEDTFSATAGGFDVKAPLRLAVDGVLQDNPGLGGFVEGQEVSVVRDGHQVIALGWFDHPDVDLQTGWATMHCRPMVADIDRTNHGTGTGTGWVSTVPPTEEDPDPDGPLIEGGWAPANADLGDGSGPDGYAVAVGYGDEKKNPWHFGFQQFVVPAKHKLHLTCRVNISGAAGQQGIITMNRINPSNPKTHVKIPVSIPNGIARDTWSDKFSLSVVEGPCRCNVAVWSPVKGKGVNRYQVQVRLVNEDPEEPDDTATVVLHGGGSTDMVGALLRECFQKNHRLAFASWPAGAGQYFADGMLVEADDFSTYASLIGQWSSSTEYRWNAEARTVEVGPTNFFGKVWHELRTQVEGAARAHALSLNGSSSGRAGRITTTASGTDRKFAYTWDTGGPFDVVRSTPTGLDPVAYGEQVKNELSVYTQPLTVVLDPPPGGRSSGDWLAWGVKVGDLVPVAVKAGPWSNQANLRITKAKLDGEGDKLTLTLEPTHL